MKGSRFQSKCMNTQFFLTFMHGSLPLPPISPHEAASSPAFVELESSNHVITLSCATIPVPLDRPHPAATSAALWWAVCVCSPPTSRRTATRVVGPSPQVKWVWWCKCPPLACSCGPRAAETACGGACCGLESVITCYCLCCCRLPLPITAPCFVNLARDTLLNRYDRPALRMAGGALSAAAAPTRRPTTGDRVTVTADYRSHGDAGDGKSTVQRVAWSCVA